ncbi:MAG: CDP-glycerol glycerophosphotransferase family protein, partial [Ruminococcus sp.]|nr:CDP-glycerol glycerophosphotransferase family protein [Ruminococcus sp.]
LTLCIAQNKINVLQLAAGKFNRYATTIFMVAFSTYFAFLVPHGVGVYWICGNLFGIIPMVLINIIIPPNKYVDLGYLKRIKQERIAKEEKYRKYHKKERADYKRFFKNGDVELVFYSEANGFYKYYKDTIDYICEHSDVAIHYVTSDPEDKIFLDTRENIHAYYIARDAYLIPFFMKLSCKVVVMTTPDLEKYHIKRSRVNKNIEYIYVQHGMGSLILTNRKGALDWFDTVLCTSKDIVGEVREMEEFYKTPKKLIVEAGYPVLDMMTREYESMPHEKHEIPQIVIAPSWQPDNIIELCGEKLLDELSQQNFEVTLRPHPQHVKHSPQLFSDMKEKYAQNKNITIQTDFTSNNMLGADVLITDWSGIAYEYAFVTKKPVLFINTPMKTMNNDYKQFKSKPNNILFRDMLGEQLSPDELEKAGSVITKMLDNQQEYSKKIDEVYREYIFNPGSAGKVCARYILRSLGKI